MPTAKIVETLKKYVEDFKRQTNNKIDDINNEIAAVKNDVNNEIAAVKNDVKTNSNKIQTNSNKIHVFHNTTTVAISTTTTTTATTAPEQLILITGGRADGGGYNGRGLRASTEVYPIIKTCSTPSLPIKTSGHALFMTAGTTPRVAYCGGYNSYMLN